MMRICLDRNAYARPVKSFTFSIVAWPVWSFSRSLKTMTPFCA